MIGLVQESRVAAVWRRVAATLLAFAAIGVATAAEARPLPEARCLALRDGLERVLDITPAFNVWEEEVELEPLGRQPVCRLSFRGTGVTFETADRRGFDDAVEAIREALRRNGWVETPAQSPFAADGPLATRFAVAKARNICVVSVSLGAAPERLGMAAPDLPQWRLMSLRPVQRLYSIQLSCVAPESG